MEYLVMFWPWKLLLLWLALLSNFGAAQNQRRESRCSDKGPPIRFPFQLKDDHHRPMNQQGYPGFELSCNGTNTVLELPDNSVKLFVKEINYKSQEIELYDPNNCIIKPLLRMQNLSKSPFHFTESDRLSNYTLFNCSKEDQMGFYYFDSSVSCLNGLSYSIYFVLSDSTIDYLSPYCKKMYNNTSLVPINENYVTGFNDRNNLPLGWSKPSCGHCEAKGNICRWKNNSTTQLETECFNPNPTSEGHSTKFVAIGATLGGCVLIALLVLAYRAYSSNKQKKQNHLRIERFLDDYKAQKPSRYSYADIKHITCQFKDKLGEGAFGTVFKGKLSEDFFVAVKLLNNTSKGNGEEFINEVAIIGQIHHVNVVRLVGYCADGFIRALVYEFLPYGSLQRFISSPDTERFLGWNTLHEIALGIAKGIEYLHQGCDQRILHFDIKPHNVLLDQNFTPKISDFGTAKLCSKDQSLVSMTTARGTMGYIAPEVFSRNFGKVSYKSDVYSFGMVLLEMVGGRKISEITKDKTSDIYYPEWIYNLLEEGEDLRIDVGEEKEAAMAKKLAIVGLCCIQWHPVDRPSMKAVVQMLEGEGTLSLPPNPFVSDASAAKMVHSNPKRHMNLGLQAIPELDS